MQKIKFNVIYYIENYISTKVTSELLYFYFLVMHYSLYFINVLHQNLLLIANEQI